jgi:exportin-5
MAQANGVKRNQEFDTANILHALEAIHNPSTSNDVRRQASDFLEQLKSSDHAFEQGLAFGSDRSQKPLVRHLGLSLLEHVIRHQSHQFDDEQNVRVRSTITDLGRSISHEDPLFVRNKVAELWIELAKRSWALDWFDLDQILCEFWSQGSVYKEFVLTVLENLSEDTFAREDPTAVLRGKDLNTALVEIFTSTSNFSGGIKIGDTTQRIRYGDEGWLARISRYLESYLREPGSDAGPKTTTLKALATLRSAFGWVMSVEIVTAGCLPVACNCMTRSDEDVIMAATDTLIALFSRHNIDQPEVEALVYPLCNTDSVDILQQVYTWSVVGVDEIISQKYAISKKLSELVSLLSDLMVRFSPPGPASLEPLAFLHFLILIAQHQSPIVSIPGVHAWVKLLEMPSWRRDPAVASCVAPLLDVVCSGLIQYDQLPDDTDEPAVIFVSEEIEIFPEKQGFYLNYRRLNASVIEWICYTHLEQALDFILAQVSVTLDETQHSDASFSPGGYQRISPLSLRADSQFAIVDAAYKGLGKWLNAHKHPSHTDVEQVAQRARQRAKTWATEMLSKYRFQDPQIKQRQIKTAVEISSYGLQKDTQFAFVVLEHILSSFIPTNPAHCVYSEAVSELHSYSTGELRRLSLSHADYFSTFYDQLSSKFGDLISQLHVDQRVQVDLKSILFLIVQRASSADADQQQGRLWAFLQPLLEGWQDPENQAAWSNFDAFTKSQRFDAIGDFLASINAVQIEDWTVVQTSQAGAQLQREMSDAFFKLPLRETRVFLSLSTERLEQDSAMHKMISELWMRMIGPVLSAVLQIVRYNHQLHDLSAWPNCNSNQLPAIQRVLRDRYWQSGISEGSMNEFHMKVKSSKTSLEGFASSVRGRIRNNLEQCYSIIHTFGRLGEPFYGMPEVPSMLAAALLSTSGHLSPHHFAVMLLMLPKLIEECPPQLRQQFLTPVLSELLQQVDAKLVSEWMKIGDRKQIKHDEENLSDEMRDDSVLRQTTYKAVNMVSAWLDPKLEVKLSTKKTIVNGNHHANPHETQSMRHFVLSNRHVLEPLLAFCTHALNFKDGKAAHIMVMTVMRIVTAYTNDHYLQGEEAAAVREYISEEIMKAAITALHDGYYADYQQYYAQLIATIWLSYGLPAHVAATETHPAHDRPALTATPRNVLMSLPGTTDAKVDAAAQKLLDDGGLYAKSKKLRAVILNLLEGVRGVRISELGKIDDRGARSRILEKYKAREAAGMQGVEDGQRRDSAGGVDLGGVSEMFGGA